MRGPICLITLALIAAPVAVCAQTPAPTTGPAAAPQQTTHPKYDENTPFRILLHDRASRAVFEAHWPVIVDSVELGGVPDTRTMKEAAASESARTKGGLTDEVYAKIIAELAKL
jgi:hypothetical protein